MKNDYSKINGFDKPISSLTAKERCELIEEYERARFDVTFHIEMLLSKLAKQTRMKRLKRRRHKLGDSINDIGAE